MQCLNKQMNQDTLQPSSSSTNGFMKELEKGALIPLCHLSNASAKQIQYNIIQYGIFTCA